MSVPGLNNGTDKKTLATNLIIQKYTMTLKKSGSDIMTANYNALLNLPFSTRLSAFWSPGSGRQGIQFTLFRT